MVSCASSTCVCMWCGMCECLQYMVCVCLLLSLVYVLSALVLVWQQLSGQTEGVVQEVGVFVYDMTYKKVNIGDHPKQFKCCVCTQSHSMSCSWSARALLTHLQPASIYSSLFIDECSVNNRGCHHICVNYPTGPVCKCNKGYALHEEKCYGEEGTGWV